MAYQINGKVYTDHALMDEIVYNCKLILEGVVVKNDVLAGDFEDESFIDDTEVFMMIKDNILTFSVFPFTAEILTAFGYDRSTTNSILINKENTPITDREKLLSFASKYFMENYEEKNDYYRMLIGLPPYNTTEFNVYIDDTYFPSNYTREVDFSKPLHEFDTDILAVLEATGKMKQILNEYKGSSYAYLKFLGDKKIDLYKARKAGKYDILYMPEVESLVMDRFKEIYDLNKDIYLKRTYSDAYAYNSDYYEQTMILLIICQTFNDIIVEVQEWYIRRDIFDIRSVQYFLESFGVAFYKEIPLKYQIRIVKNLNKLIKYKSSNKNFADILEIFGSPNTSIYKYYLYKKRLRDSVGNYIPGAFDKDMYELEFVQAKINESYDDYIKDLIYRTPYDDITYQDKYWDGQEEHSVIKQKHINRDFTIEGTKYMSIEYKVSMSEYLFQMQFFLGLVLDSNIDTNDIKIAIPSIQTSIKFRLSDLFLFLFLLTYGYDNCNTNIIRPNLKDKNTDDRYKDKPEFEKYDDYNGGYSWTKEDEYDLKYSPNGGDGNTEGHYLAADGGSNVEYSEIKSIEDFYDWMKKYYPDIFIENKDRVYGFNSNVNLDTLSNILHERHSQFQFDKGFTLADLGVDKYIVPTKISTIDELTSIYFNNKECYDTLKNKIVHEADDRDEFITYQFIFNSLFTKQFDYKGYTINNYTEDAKQLEQILREKDYVLYATYTKIMSESNMETRRDNIRNIMNDIVNTLEYYLNGEGLEYIFAFTTIASFSAIVRYIYLLINFFKSYKVYFLDPFITYVVDDRLENNARGAGDAIAEKKITYWKWDKSFARDNVAVNAIKIFDEDKWRDRIVETLDIHGHFDPDINDDYDYDGMYADTENSTLVYKDADGGYADPKSCIPYIMLNAGTAQGSNIDIWDLNGAGALEMKEYVDVDGGYQLHKEDGRKDYWNSGFKYIIDGGSAGTNQFLTKSMYVQVIDRQIQPEIRISKLVGNTLMEAEDGLYVKQSWTNWSDFDEFKADASDTFDYFTEMYEILKDNIIVSSDEALLDLKIDNSISSYLGGMRKVVSYLESEKFENSLLSYTDSRVQQLYDEFYSFSPYSWENF